VQDFDFVGFKSDGGQQASTGNTSTELPKPTDINDEEIPF
jgi:hypothetical protein